jgi:hypothetical protein
LNVSAHHAAIVFAEVLAILEREIGAVIRSLAASEGSIEAGQASKR